MRFTSTTYASKHTAGSPARSSAGITPALFPMAIVRSPESTAIRWRLTPNPHAGCAGFLNTTRADGAASGYTFELPKWLVEPAVRSCRLFNTALHFIFYDVPTL